MQVRGVENLPEQGGYILAVSHQSFFDPFIIGWPVPGYITFMARDTLWKSRIYRFGEFLFNASFPIRRGGADREALREAQHRIRDGRIVLMFPEGTRTRDGSLGEVKKGPASVSIRAGAPIVPAIIKGAYRVWPRGRKIPDLRPWPFNRLKVAYGTPIYPQDYPGETTRERVERITRMLRFRMHELFDTL